MNREEFAEKAITIEQLSFRQDVSISEAADVCLRLSQYPEPRYGVTIYSGPRGDTNGGIDWGVRHLRRGIAGLIEFVAEDCVSVVNNLDGVDTETRQAIAKAIRAHFEILPH
jgi:hypothetical protein